MWYTYRFHLFSYSKDNIIFSLHSFLKNEIIDCKLSEIASISFAYSLFEQIKITFSNCLRKNQVRPLKFVTTICFSFYSTKYSIFQTLLKFRTIFYFQPFFLLSIVLFSDLIHWFLSSDWAALKKQFKLFFLVILISFYYCLCISQLAKCKWEMTNIINTGSVYKAPSINIFIIIYTFAVTISCCLSIHCAFMNDIRFYFFEYNSFKN